MKQVVRSCSLRPRSVALVALVAASGCTLFTDLSGLSGGAGDAGAADAAVEASAADAADGGADARVDATADGGAYAREVLADRPIAYFHLDEPPGSKAVSDAVGAELGQIAGGVSMGVPTLLAGAPGTAAAFSPGGGVATIRVAPEPRLEPSKAITVEVWFRSGDVVPTTMEFSLVSYGTDTVAPIQEAWVLFVSSTGPAFYIGEPGGGASKAARTGAPIAANTTYFFAGTYDGTVINCYVDGVLAASTPATGTITGYDQVHGLSIGAEYTGKYTATGTIDEVAIYATALSPARIAAHGAAGR